jgi:hypothetical protein
MPGRVEGLQDRPITQAHRLARVRLGQHLLDFRLGQHVFRQPMFQPRQFQFTRWVVEQVILLGAPLEERPHRNEPRVLGAERQGVTIALAVGVQTPLISLQDRLGDLSRSHQAALVAPGDEHPEIRLPVLHRGGGVVVDLEPFEVLEHVGGEPLRVARRLQGRSTGRCGARHALTPRSPR